MPNHHQTFKPALSYPGKILNAYQQKIHQQQQILKLIKSALPFELAQHALHCVIADKKLLIYTDSANWSSQLRFYHSVILKRVVDSGLKQVQLVQIRIIPEQIQSSIGQMTHIPSRKNIESIRLQAEAQTDDKLNAALLKLCDTLDRLSNK